MIKQQYLHYEQLLYVTIATIDSLELDTEANTVAGKLKDLIKDII